MVAAKPASPAVSAPPTSPVPSPVLTQTVPDQIGLLDAGQTLVPVVRPKESDGAKEVSAKPSAPETRPEVAQAVRGQNVVERLPPVNDVMSPSTPSDPSPLPEGEIPIYPSTGVK